MPTSDKINLPRVRLSFPRLVTAKAFEEGQEERFEATFLLDPSNKLHVPVIKTISKTGEKIAKEHWGTKYESVRKKLASQRCFGMADNDGKIYDGYEGMFYIATHKRASDGRPLVVNRKGDPVQAGDEDFPYAGCYVNATISLWTNHHPKGGPRIISNLRAIQFAADGEPFSAAAVVDAESEFEEFDNDFDDDPLDDDDLIDL